MGRDEVRGMGGEEVGYLRRGELWGMMKEKEELMKEFGKG